ncbi:MAG TPA: hypothetical protein VGC99_18220, partial [Candidatus Tectomicrobia bacterium]
MPTELPVRAALRPSRGQWACRGGGRQLRQRNKVPRVLLTDGLQADASLVPGAKHVWCRVHQQQSGTPWLPRPFATAAEITARKSVMKPLFQTRDQRPVRRRLARLRDQAPELGSTPWVSRVEEKLSELLCTVGSVCLPSTTKAIERFFRAFERCYKTRRGFPAVRSAKPALILFLVVSVFTQHAPTGHAPIEVILPEARRM